MNLSDGQMLRAASPSLAGAEMGIAAGGRMEQQIYPDPHGTDTWNNDSYGRVYVHIVNSAMFEQITGRKPPATPVTAQTYAQHGYPWFDLYDEHLGDVELSETLANVKSVSEMDDEHGFGPQQDDSTVEIPNGQVVIQHPPKTAKGNPALVGDGNWPH
jgi:hypothetical protein